jgi:hypothetical protein
MFHRNDFRNQVVMIGVGLGLVVILWLIRLATNR